jgi:hypothetical protein
MTDIKNLSAVVGAILSCITLATLLIKPLRVTLVRWVERVSGSTETEKQLKAIMTEVQALQANLAQEQQVSKETTNQILHDLQDLKDANTSMLGNMIKQMYLSHQDTKRISEREFDVLTKLYRSYHNVLNGNGVIEHIYNEIETEWEIEI